MKKTKMFLKAVVVIGIALAFVMPGAAMVTERETKEIIQPAKFLLQKPASSRNR